MNQITVSEYKDNYTDMSRFNIDYSNIEINELGLGRKIEPLDIAISAFTEKMKQLNLN